MGRKSRHDSVLTIALCVLPDLDHGVEVAGAALCEEDIAHRCHLAYGAVDLRFIRRPHQEFVFIAGREDAVVDGVAFTVDTVELDHRLLAHGVVGARDIDKRPFRRRLLADIALEHDLGIGNPDAVPTLSDTEFTAHQLSSVGEFFTLRNTCAGGKCHQGMGADGDRDRESFPAGKRRLQHGVGVTPFHEPGHHMTVVDDHHPVDGGVLDAVAT